MLSLDPAWLMVLPVVFALGWFAAGIDRQQSKLRRRSDFRRVVDAVLALVQGQGAAAIPHLLAAARESEDNLNIQRALGTLFRQQGQPDRAIEVRQSLLAKTQLSDKEREALLLELAEDFLQAGLFDRTEDTLQALIAQSPSTDTAVSAQTLRHQLMARQGRWAEALQAADWLALQAQDPSLLREARFHYQLNLGLVEAAEQLIPGHPRLSEAPKGPQICRSCGFRTSQHAWQCPGCFGWDTQTPLTL